MKFFRLIGHGIRDGLRSIIRNFSLSLASISCIIVTLLIVAIAIVLSYNVDNFGNLIKKDFTMVVFIKPDITDTEHVSIKTNLETIKNISEIKYESKDEIAITMGESSDMLANILKELDNNPLQDTYLIKVKDVTKISSTASRIKSIEGVDYVEYGEKVISNVISFFDKVNTILIFTVIGLVIVTAFLISNTIKITIMSRSDEIDIMRLVGASNFAIKLPFIIEGLILGVIGSLIPIITTIYGYTTLYQNFDAQSISPFITLVSPIPLVYMISLILLGIGAVVGMWGSSKAVRKYLKI